VVIDVVEVCFEDGVALEVFVGGGVGFVVGFEELSELGLVVGFGVGCYED